MPRSVALRSKFCHSPWSGPSVVIDSWLTPPQWPAIFNPMHRQENVMKTYLAFATLCSLVSTLAPSSHAASSGAAFYGDPPDEHHPWAVHDPNRPQPKVVTPGSFSTPEQPGKPPSDAIILFDGKDLSQWESAKDGSAAKWAV